MRIKRGDVYLADLDERFGSEQIGVRPVVILQNDKGNKYAPTVTVAPITTKIHKNLPTHVLICNIGGIKRKSVILCEQITTVDKNRLLTYMGRIDNRTMNTKVRHCLEIQLDLTFHKNNRGRYRR